MARKRKRTSGDDEQAEAAPKEGANTEDQPNPYELQRQKLIEQNRQRLIALGIPAAVTGLNRAIADAKPKPKKERQKKAPRGPQQPTRASSRLKGETAKEDAASELALFFINGDCPRCGKVLSQGFRQHLEWCKGSRKEPRRRESAGGDQEAGGDDDEEDDPQQLAAIEASKEPHIKESAESIWQPRMQEAERIQRMDKKLCSLHLDGLVDFTEEAAKFVVLGSTKKHYTVTLSDDRHTCQCVDFRVRKHHCKHIRLVLTQLDIAGSPREWHKAVERKLDEAQNDVLDQPLAQRAKASSGERAAEPAKGVPPDKHVPDAAMAAKFL